MTATALRVFPMGGSRVDSVAVRVAHPEAEIRMTSPALITMAMAVPTIPARMLGVRTFISPTILTMTRTSRHLILANLLLILSREIRPDSRIRPGIH